jgi:glycosyltransferase involved in cell wall biosynthesis
LRAVVAGEGPDRQRLERLAADRGLNGRVEFVGRVSDEVLADLYAGCLGVFYAPVDEDFGMVPFEAFLSGKPVLTTTDAGGPLDVVRDGETGVVVSPEPAEVARGLVWLRSHGEDARAYGARGREVAATVTWDACIERLLAAAAS